jgi:hypothetical protein
MTEQEQADLDVMKAAILGKKLGCYSYMESLDRADARQLECSGYKGKTNAEAMQHAFRMFQQDIKKLIDQHVKKYPDR